VKAAIASGPQKTPPWFSPWFSPWILSPRSNSTRRAWLCRRGDEWRKQFCFEAIYSPLFPLGWASYTAAFSRKRRRSLYTSAPHRMTATAQASGAWCWQRSHQSHTQGVARCSSPRVGIGPDCMRANWPIQKTSPKLPPKTFENHRRIFSCRPAPDRRAPGLGRRRAVSRCRYQRCQRPRWASWPRPDAQGCVPAQVRWAIDRLGRSLIDLLGTIQTLEASGVDLNLDQQAIDTTTAAGKLMFQVF
jgi:hypothetical protein